MKPAVKDFVKAYKELKKKKKVLTVGDVAKSITDREIKKQWQEFLNKQ